MRLEPSSTVMAALAVCLVAAAAAAGDPNPVSAEAVATAAAVGGAREVPCLQVATAWPVSGSGAATLEAPQLAVVLIDIRPKDGMVFLDDRFAGRARYFNGTNGFLYLEPGSYRLELRLDGYRTEAFEIAAQPSCRFEIRHRMQRARGSTADGTALPVGRGVPEQWVWAPVGGAAAALPDAARPAGPDPALRPDLGLGTTQSPEARPPRGTLRLLVKPPTAEVYLDGSFLATGRELDLMVAPLAVPLGPHVIEARAPGFASRFEEVSVTEGEVVELEIVLQRGPG